MDTRGWGREGRSQQRGSEQIARAAPTCPECHTGEQWCRRRMDVGSGRCSPSGQRDGQCSGSARLLAEGCPEREKRDPFLGSRVLVGPAASIETHGLLRPGNRCWPHCAVTLVADPAPNCLELALITQITRFPHGGYRRRVAAKKGWHTLDGRWFAFDRIVFFDRGCRG